MKKFLTIFSVILGLLAASTAVYVLFFKNRYETSNSESKPSLSLSSPTPVVDPKNPFDEIKVDDGNDKAYVDGNMLVSNSGRIVLPDGVEVNGLECATQKPSDFCLTARIVKDGQDFYTYFVKDMTHSRIFDTVESFQKTHDDISGATIGSFIIKLGGKNMQGVGVVQHDGSGWLFLGDYGVNDFVKLSKIEQH